MSDHANQTEDILEWYGAKTVCKHERTHGEEDVTLFEERVVLLRAKDFDDAIARGEAEVLAYCDSLQQVVYVEYINVYRLFADTIDHGTEVFSLMRESELTDSEYLDRFHDDGRERTQVAE